MPPGPKGLYEFEALMADVGLSEAIESTIDAMPPGQPDKAVVQASDVPLDVQAAIAEYAASMGYGPDGGRVATVVVPDATRRPRPDTS